MKLFNTMLLVSLIIGVSVEISFAKFNNLTKKQLKHYKPLKANEGKALKSLTISKLSDVHLAKPVKYFDIKSYAIGIEPLTQKSYSGGWSFDMDAYKKLSTKEKKRIRSVSPIMSQDPFGATYYADSPMREIYNVHYIDMHSKVHTFASRKELLAFLGMIDTPTELHMALLNSYGKIRYKKIENLYIIREDSVTYEDYDGGDYDCHLDVSHKIMDNRGNILLSEQIKSQGYREKECNILNKKLESKKR